MRRHWRSTGNVAHIRFICQVVLYSLTASWALFSVFSVCGWTRQTAKSICTDSKVQQVISKYYPRKCFKMSLSTQATWLQRDPPCGWLLNTDLPLPYFSWVVWFQLHDELNGCFLSLATSSCLCDASAASSVPCACDCQCLCLQVSAPSLAAPSPSSSSSCPEWQTEPFMHPKVSFCPCFSFCSHVQCQRSLQRRRSLSGWPSLPASCDLSRFQRHCKLVVPRCHPSG